MAYLTKQQVTQIIQNAPAGVQPGEVVMALQQQGHKLEGFDDAQTEASRIKTPGEKIAGATGMSAFGQGIGRTIFNAQGGTKGLQEAEAQKIETTDKLIRQIQENKKKGKDNTRLIKALEDLGVSMQEGAYDIEQAGTGGLSNRQVIGSALQTGINAVTAGTLTRTALGGKSFQLAKGAPNLVGGGTAAPGVVRGTLGGVKSGLATGALEGAASGVASEIGSNRDLTVGGVTRSAIGGGLLGGTVGGALGGIGGGIGGVMRNRSAASAAMKESLSKNPELSSKFGLDKSGRLVKDKTAAEAIKQGLDERQVAVIKNANAIDKRIMREMTNIAERGSKNLRQVERPTDLPGATFLKRAKHLKDTLKRAGQEVEVAASSLKGQKVQGGERVLAEFQDELLKAGVAVDETGLNFVGSDFENLADVEKAIGRIYNRLTRAGNSAYELHRLKRYIDEVVDYGSSGEGLKGRSQNLLKALRARVDNLLDMQFAPYNKANTKFRDAIQGVEEVGDLMGSRFNLSNVDSEFAKMKAGGVMRRILGNGAGRADILQAIKKIEDTAKKYGFKSNDDLVTQVVFADVLEEVFGNQATTGLQGQVARGVDAGVSALRGNFVDAAVNIGKGSIDAARGINREAKIKALKALLGLLN